MAETIADRYNYCGADYDDVLAVLPGVAEADCATDTLTGRQVIEFALSRACARVLGTVSASVRQWVNAQPRPVTVYSLAAIVATGAAAELAGNLLDVDGVNSVAARLVDLWNKDLDRIAADTWRPPEMPDEVRSTSCYVIDIERG